MASDNGPRKMGVYEGAGTQRSQSKTVLAVVAAIVVLLVVLTWIV